MDFALYAVQIVKLCKGLQWGGWEGDLQSRNGNDGA